jgi:1-acyl-sn-glycerol-3-phosphate acyltransferase
MTILRSAIFNLVFFLVTFILTLVAGGAWLLNRAWVVSVARFWARLLLRLARLICGIRLDVSGLENLPRSGSVLIASRHESALDTFVWMILLPDCCYVLKRELLRIPLFGPLLSAAGMIAIDRTAGAAAIRSLLRAGSEAAALGRQIVIFPEGTRSQHGQPGPLQPGVAALAAKAGLLTLPVSTDSGLCWGRRAFRKRPGTIHIVIGAPLSPDMARPQLLAAIKAGMTVLDARPSDSRVKTCV